MASSLMAGIGRDIRRYVHSKSTARAAVPLLIPGDYGQIVLWSGSTSPQNGATIWQAEIELSRLFGFPYGFLKQNALFLQRRTGLRDSNP
jgi:hypothetical protein